MTNERRYGEEEVAEIFEAATTTHGAQRRVSSTADGLTLTQLQAIGSEVGVAPDRIAAAASALDLRRGVHPRRTHLGMPISVGRTVDLPRAPTDREWELLVSELRKTFNAQGKDGSSGNLRAWTNSNLHAYVEPTEAGYRFRIGTLKGDAATLNWTGAAGMLAGLILAGPLLVTGQLTESLVGPGFIGIMGAAAFAYNAVRLPRWAHEREEQMEYMAQRVQTLIKTDTGEP
jgi:hypothetical protein